MSLPILGDPGASSRDDAIFSGKNDNNSWKLSFGKYRSPGNIASSRLAAFRLSEDGTFQTCKLDTGRCFARSAQLPLPELLSVSFGNRTPSRGRNRLPSFSLPDQ